ncbi:MAG: ABC transporter ATP-binding protein [Planctomycetota bacterium]
MPDPIIRVDNLWKNYGDIVAVQDVSFEVMPGEIVGLLGPNGAGKSTIIRILTGYIPATRGTARVDGLEVYRHGLEVRARVGYLPENTPLYDDMRVCEYLRYRAKLKGVRRGQLRGRVDEVIDRCRLGDMHRRIIGHLSKGYRQRVGLADALVHDPPILILDEPTVGLDPLQVRQMRQLILDLSARHTIIFSSHILTEVEAVCRRVIILDRGQAVDIQEVEPLRTMDRLQVELDEPVPEKLETALQGIEGVRQVLLSHRKSGVLVTLVYDPAADVRRPVVQLLQQEGAHLVELRRQKRSLEQRFIEVIKP